MAALTGTRMTGDKIGFGEKGYLQKGSTIIYPGAMVAINAGYAAPATHATGLNIKGAYMRDLPADNSGGGDGAAVVVLCLSDTPNGKRYYKFDNDPGGGALAQGDVGAVVYALDDHTVTKTSTGASIAGEFVELDADGGIWIAFK